MNQIVKGALLGIFAGLIGYLVVGTIMFGYDFNQSGKALGAGLRNRMMMDPVPITVGLVLLGITFWYVGMRR